MIPRPIRLLLIACGVIAFLAVLAFPLFSLTVRVVGDWRLPDDGYIPSSRQWTLMGRTTALAAAGAAAAMVLALPGAFAVGRFGRLSNAPILAALLILPLMLPPMVFAFGWQRLLGAHGAGMRDLGPLLRCVLIWATWAWPIPAMILGSGWSRVGRGAYESALLVSGSARAFLFAVMPSLARHALVSTLILFTLFVGEYSVPHANGVIVVATELLSYAQSTSPAECLRQSVPIMGLVLALLVGIRIVWPSFSDAQCDPRAVDASRPFGWLRLTIPVIVVATSLFPIAVLACRANLPAEVSEAYATYGGELIATLAVCGVAGLAVTLIGIAVVGTPWLRLPGIATACIAGVLPGAIVGEAALAAYQSVDAIYNHWPILVIGLAARFGWIGVLAAWLASLTVPRDLVGQAAVDGADAGAARLSIQLRNHWPVILAGWLIASAMAMGDVAVVSIVQVPTPRMMSTILIEKFHRFETGMLVAMSLWMVACVVPGAILTAFVVRRRRG